MQLNVTMNQQTVTRQRSMIMKTPTALDVLTTAGTWLSYTLLVVTISASFYGSLAALLFNDTSWLS